MRRAGSLCADALQQLSRGPELPAKGRDLLRYVAPNEEAIREHGRRGGLAVTRITELAGTIDPATAERVPTQT